MRTVLLADLQVMIVGFQFIIACVASNPDAITHPSHWMKALSTLVVSKGLHL